MVFVTVNVESQRQIKQQQKPVFPQIEVSDASLVILLRHTGIGWEEAFGFDTVVYRYFGGAEAGFVGATLSEIHPEGERIAARYRISEKFGDTFILASLAIPGGFGSETLESTIVRREGGFEVSGRQARMVRREGSGLVSFAAPDGNYQERYTLFIDGQEVRKIRGGQIVAEGRFLPPWIGGSDGAWLRYVERKPRDAMGAEAIEFHFWQEPGGVSFRAEGVEPLAEGYIRGFPAFSDSDYWLRNLAITDAIAGEGGILRVVYIAANTFQSVSSSGGGAVNSSSTPVLGCGNDSFQEWSMILPEEELLLAPYLRSPFIGHPIAAN